MSANSYSEDQLIQRSAAEFLEKELGWQSVYAYDSEVLGLDGTLGRKTYRDVILEGRLIKSLKKLNRDITPQQIDEVIERISQQSSSQSLMQINERKYNYLRDGVPVKNTDENGVDEEIKIKIIDFDNPDNNDFLCVRELWVYGSIYHRRADIVGFVNGLPLLFVELKNHNVAVEDAFNNNYRDYLDTIPQLFISTPL